MLPQLSNNLTKTELKTIAEQSIEQISDNGQYLQAAQMLAVMETFIKEIRANESFVDGVRTELTKFGKSYESNNMKLELCETGVKYDYSQCGCWILPELERELESIENKIRMRKEFIKRLPHSIEVLNETTGELVTIYPPAKSSTSSFKATIKK